MLKTSNVLHNIEIDSMKKKPKAIEANSYKDLTGDQIAAIIEWCFLSIVLIVILFAIFQADIFKIGALTQEELTAKLLLSYWVAAVIPGTILLYTTLKNLTDELFLKCTGIVIGCLILFRLIAMNLSRIGCGKSCNNEFLSYESELAISLVFMPLLIAVTMITVYQLKKTNIK